MLTKLIYKNGSKCKVRYQSRSFKKITTKFKVINEKLNVAVIVGAGNGTRFGEDKIFKEINEKPIWYYSARAFQMSEKVDEIVMVVKEEKIKQMLQQTNDFELSKIKKIVEGGSERKDSVWKALGSMNKNETNLVLIHDGARPLVSTSLINKCIDETVDCGCVVPGIKVRDTIKRGGEFVEETLDRNEIYLIQTPQVFEYGIIARAYDNAVTNNLKGTDDSSLVESLGYRVKIIPGEESNLKITYQNDLELVDFLMSRR